MSLVPLVSSTTKLHAFINDVAIPHDSDECLIWPYSKAGNGYGAFMAEGKRYYAHRYVCEFFHGPPLPGKTECAHSCGIPACVNARHLRWASKPENMADRLLHGTHARGENCPTSKLKRHQVLEILRLRGVVSGKELAREYGVNKSTITLIHTGKTWTAEFALSRRTTLNHNTLGLAR